MSIITNIATGIGFIVLMAIAVLAALTLGSAIHDWFRCKFPKYDMYLYDEVARWNKKLRKRGQ